MGCLSYAALVLWLLGYPEHAVQRNSTALALGKTLAHPFSHARTVTWAAILAQFRREKEEVSGWARETIALATAHGFPLWEAVGTVLQGWTMAAQGDTAAGLAQIWQGLDALRGMGAQGFRPYFLALKAEVLGMLGQLEAGVAVLRDAFAVVELTRERFYEAELHRLHGTLLLLQAGGDHASAVTCFQRALAVARSQQAKALELRAATSLSRLWQQHGKRDEARQLLGEIYGWFTEGFATVDLQEAKALLEAFG
jgi:predicted ATPase